MADGSKIIPLDMDKAEREERIKAEIKRIDMLFKKVDRNKKKLADGLIKRASFMRITLEDLENDINEHGTIELFTQSENTEPYERKRPNVESYIKMNSAYQTIIKQLYNIYGEEAGDSEKEDDGFDDFIQNK